MSNTILSRDSGLNLYARCNIPHHSFWAISLWSSSTIKNSKMRHSFSHKKIVTGMSSPYFSASCFATIVLGNWSFIVYHLASRPCFTLSTSHVNIAHTWLSGCEDNIECNWAENEWDKNPSSAWEVVCSTPSIVIAFTCSNVELCSSVMWLGSSF